MKRSQGTTRIESIRHSLAHILAMAVLKKFPQAKLGVGPVIENGFYYDFLLSADQRGHNTDSRRHNTISDADLAGLEKTMQELIEQKLEFTGEKLTPAKAKKLFADQQFKLDLIKDFIKEKKQLTAYYTCPPPISYKLKAKSCFFDLCRGGHIKNTSEINSDAFKLTKVSGAYWKGDQKNPQLTRIYGIAFETKKELEKYLKLQEEIEKRDHRVLGEKLELFSQHDIAPGAIFWHPKGMILWRVLEKFMREKLDASGYGEVSTPIMVKKEVFVKSGHFEHYRENMFTLESEKETYVLKPMNCPESTYIYSSRLRSYRDLPIRFSEITDRLHRNELSGTLGGLFRVRQMSQDDAHIYCAPNQIENEVNKLLDLIQDVYKKFDLPVSFKLATKPDKAMGSPVLWKKAEAELETILKKTGKPYEIKPKDGAFYGPKIDIHINDSLGRDWQLATIQLDFQLAEKFDLTYTDETGKKERPVVIHRAILGTFERFIGILIEHFAGEFPFWLAPVQTAVLTVTDRASPYAEEIIKTLKNKDVRVSYDQRNETIGKKIREAEIQKIPYIIIIGDREIESKTISIRQHKKGDLGKITIEEFLQLIEKKK